MEPVSVPTANLCPSHEKSIQLTGEAIRTDFANLLLETVTKLLRKYSYSEVNELL